MTQTLLFAATLAAAVTATSTAAAASDRAAASCDRRADVVALRAADEASRATLRKRLDEEVAAASGRAKGCAAAVAAQAALNDGDKARALALLAVTVAALPELSVPLAPQRALLAAEVGRVDESKALWALVPQSSVDAEQRLRLALARASGDPQAAKPLLQERSSRDPAALDALCADGDQRRCHDLLVRWPGHPLARAREDAIDLSAIPDFDVVDYARRGKNLLAAARPQRAVLEAERWLQAQPVYRPGRSFIVANLTQGLLRLGKNREAVAVSVLDLGAVALDDGVIDQARAHAKALGRDGRFADAAAFWGRLGDAAVAANRADVAAEAAFLGAFSFVEGDLADDALTAFAAAAARVAGTSWETQLLWQQAFLTLTAKQNTAAALPFFDAVVALNDKEVRKHRYWRARALDVVDPPRARREREALLGEDPVDWYAHLCRRDLGKKNLSGVVVGRDALQRKNGRLIVDDEDARVTRLLWSLGFADVAKDRCRQRALLDKRPSLANIGLCQSVDDATFGWRRGGLYYPTPLTQKNRLNAASSWRVSYAAPWGDVVDAAAATAAVPPSFVYAIMRTESGFDDDAVSVAGARGALQLLPSVARAVGKLTPHSGRDDVGDHIQLGAGLLGLLLREHGSLLLAAAAYNGAPEHAQAWVRRFRALPVDVFVERIPFRETRDYVKRVLAVEAVYRGLAGGDVAVDLPMSITPAATYTTFPYDE